MEIKTEDYVQISSFAKLCDVSVTGVYLWISKGEVETINLDGRFYINKNDYKDRIKKQ